MGIKDRETDSAGACVRKDESEWEKKDTKIKWNVRIIVLCAIKQDKIRVFLR